MERIVYLDNAASAPMRPEALEAFSASARETYANPSAMHALGQRARLDIEQARAAVAALTGADASEVVFTSGATEANNLALRGALEPLLSEGKRPHVVTTALEHASVLNTLRALELRGLELTIVSPERDGVVRAETVLAAVRPETALVSVIAASNELGSLQPVEEIGKGLNKMDRKPLFHVDAVQAIVSMPVTAVSTGADLFTVSAHKIGGPKGVGALIVRKGLKLTPCMTGGGQERGLRSGTEPTPVIVAFGRAAEALARNRHSEHEGYHMLRTRLLDALPSNVKPFLPVSTPCAPQVAVLECEGKENDWIVLLMSRTGVMVSAGSACKAGSRAASSVVTALGLNEARAKSIIRVSFGWSTGEQDVDACLEALRAAVVR